MLKGLLESDKGVLERVMDNGEEVGDADCPLGDAVADVLGLVLLVPDKAAEISCAGNYLKPVVGETGPSSLDQRGFNHQDRLGWLREISPGRPIS